MGLDYERLVSPRGGIWSARSPYMNSPRMEVSYYASRSFAHVAWIIALA